LRIGSDCETKTREGAQRYEARRRRRAVRRRRLAASVAEDPARRRADLRCRSAARERRKPNLSGAPDPALPGHALLPKNYARACIRAKIFFIFALMM